MIYHFNLLNLFSSLQKTCKHHNRVTGHNATYSTFQLSPPKTNNKLRGKNNSLRVNWSLWKQPELGTIKLDGGTTFDEELAAKKSPNAAKLRL